MTIWRPSGSEKIRIALREDDATFDRAHVVPDKCNNTSNRMSLYWPTETAAENLPSGEAPAISIPFSRSTRDAVAQRDAH
jgi:hypothetical protein